MLISATTVRPTRHRLLVAMGVASLLLAGLMALDLEPIPGDLLSRTTDEALLTVRITDPQPPIRERPEQPPKPEDSIPDTPTSAPQQPNIQANDVEQPAVEPQPTRDWQAVIATTAKATIEDHHRREDLRAAMWQQSYSTMFRPTGEFVVTEAEPLLADVDFQQPAGVLGLGFSIGSCFFGLPLAGIPVEERTVAITIFYCRPDSG